MELKTNEETSLKNNKAFLICHVLYVIWMLKQSNQFMTKSFHSIIPTQVPTFVK